MRRLVTRKLCDRLLCNIVLNAILVHLFVRSLTRTARGMCIKILSSNYFISMLHLEGCERREEWVDIVLCESALCGYLVIDTRPCRFGEVERGAGADNCVHL